MTEAAFSHAMGSHIRQRREKLRITQLAVAQAIGVKRATICAWESSSRTVSAFHYSLLETFFDRHEAAAREGAAELAALAKSRGAKP